jgi:RNA polymerase sigma factor (sigma-70 family)
MVFGIMKNEKEVGHQFQQIIEMHKGILFKVTRAYCQNEEDRQDLIQEIMIQIWKSFHKYNDSFAITTWLYRIALNVAISHYRKNTARQVINVSLSVDILPMQQVDINEKEQQLNLLEQFISELSNLDKALMLLYLEDKSYAEISEILGLTITNVATKVGRIKEKLKKKFSQINL